MAEKKPSLIRFCACWGSSGDQHQPQDEITRKIDLKYQTSSKIRKNFILQRNATTITGTTPTTTSRSNKNLVGGHFELENSSEEGGYIQATSPTPPLLNRQASRQQVETRDAPPPSSPSSSSLRTAAATPFSPPAGCAVDIERENKQPKIRLKDSWDGLVVLHSPKTQQQQQEQEERQRERGGGGGDGDGEINNNNNQAAVATTATASPRLLNHHHYSHHSNHSHASRTRSLGAISQESQQTPPTATTTADAVATEVKNNEGDAQLEGPLATPQSLLEEISRLVAINDQKYVISALVLLTKGIKNHQQKLNQCLGELLAVITACLQSSDDKVVFNALNTATELVRMYGDSLLQHMYAQQQQQQQQQNAQDVFLLQLLLCASRSSSSSIKTNADALLKRIASKMHQSRIIKLLEPLASTQNNTALQNKAASTLLIATYRLT